MIFFWISWFSIPGYFQYCPKNINCLTFILFGDIEDWFVDVFRLKIHRFFLMVESLEYIKYIFRVLFLCKILTIFHKIAFFYTVYEGRMEIGTFLCSIFVFCLGLLGKVLGRIVQDLLRNWKGFVCLVGAFGKYLIIRPYF